MEPTVRTVLPTGWSYTQTFGSWQAAAGAGWPPGSRVVFPADSPAPWWTYPTPGCAGPAPVTWGLLDLATPSQPPDDGAAGILARR